MLKNREIKFRAWDLDRKKMVEVKNLDWGFNKRWNVNGRYFNCILMQYAGLKDKNEKPIFEGDVVFFRYDHPLGEAVAPILANEKVEFRTFFHDIPNLSYFHPFSGEFKNMRDIEVQGNVYENPELLNDSNLVRSR